MHKSIVIHDCYVAELKNAFYRTTNDLKEERNTVRVTVSHIEKKKTVS